MAGGAPSRRAFPWRWLGAALVAVGLALVGGLLAQPPAAAPAFTLTSQHGHAVSLADLRGQPVVLTFLYSHCPDTCPLTLANITAALRQQAAAGGAAPAVVVVTVDPDRDTVDRLQTFAGGWSSDWLFLTGRYQQLAPVWTAYGITVDKRPLPHHADVHHGYSLAHTSRTVIVDPAGRLTHSLTGAWTATELAAALRGAPSPPERAWQRLTTGVDAFLRACGDLASQQPGLAMSLLALLLVPGLVLPVWLLRSLVRARRTAAGHAAGRS